MSHSCLFPNFCIKMAEMTFDTSGRAVKQYRSISDENFRRSVDSVCKDFGLNILKNEQYQCIKEFMLGRDIFMNMPTGWRKSLIFQMVPFIEMRLASFSDNETFRKKAILLVICPLVALMKDQVKQLKIKEFLLLMLPVIRMNKHIAR